MDGDAGPVVRPYLVTGGRVEPASASFDVVALVTALVAPSGAAPVGLQPEHREILALTRRPMAVAEIASHLDLALGVVRVLLDDLLSEGLITVKQPAAGEQLLDDGLLEAVIHGLRAL